MTAVWVPRPGTEQHKALLAWVRANGLDPDQIIASDGVQVDGEVIRYSELVDPGTPGAEPMGPFSDNKWKRRRAAPLLVDVPADLLRRAEPRIEPAPPSAPAYDWPRYERTCAPDRQLDGLGDLCLFLGGTWAESPREASFIGVLLMLIEKGQSNRERFHALALAFPREVTAWLAWRSITDHSPTAAELCAALIANDERRRALAALVGGPMPDGYTLTNADIWGPETPAGETDGGTR